jgi:hypothetical protein
MLPWSSPDFAFVGDTTDIDRVREDLVDVPTAEQSTPCRTTTPIDARRNPNALSVELLFEADYACRLEISPE